VKRLLLAILRSAARNALPERARRSLVGRYFRFERAREASAENRSPPKLEPLRNYQAFFDIHEFDTRLVVQVNSGLRPGGVERQIVNTLVGLSRLWPDLKTGFLALRSGDTFDFFRSHLANRHEFVRSAVSFPVARRALRAAMPRAVLQKVEHQIDWLPWDVREDVIRLMSEFINMKPGVVHGWQDGTGIPAAYAARLVGVPRILISTRNMRPNNFVWYRPYMFHAYRELAECHQIVMINNSSAGAADYADWLGVPRGRFVVKRNGLDISSLRQADPRDVAALRKQLRIPAGTPVVGSIFRFDEEKRPLLWIQTAREIANQWPGCHFVIFGDGPLRNELERYAADGRISEYLRCPGIVANTALAMSLFDIFLLTSRVEGTPNAILEASALGIPVVATDAGGVRETVVEGVTGYVVTPPEPAHIACQVMRIARAPDLHARMKAAGPEFIKRCFGLERMIAETIGLYSASTSEPDSTHPS